VLGRGGGALVAWSAVLTAIVTVFFVASALALIFFVLLHSGKGGGLSDMFGGGLGATAAGSTVAEKNLDRITVVAALVFGFTCLGLAFLL
jgi:preprotein translocase subunit SecG